MAATGTDRDAPLFQRLMTRHPLHDAKARARAASGLAEAAAEYAAHAAYSGAKGPWWRVWRALERARGHRLRDAVATLKPEARRWFALWSFERGRGREGAVAYRAYLADPGGIGPFDRENALYLEQLAAGGSPADVVRVADALVAKTTTNDRVLLVILRALQAMGDGPALRARYPRPGAAELHDGNAWARHAIALASGGATSPEEASLALAMCAKLGVGSRRDTHLVDALLAALQLTEAQWKELRAPWEYSTEDLQARWLLDRGLRPEPTQDTAPHVYGGDTFVAPPCPGCGHRMHAFFVIDVDAVPELQRRLPGWRWLPLLGCVDCCLWLMRRDFRVDQEARAAELIGVAAGSAALAQFGKAVGAPLAPIRPQPVALRAIPASAEPESDQTQIGGEPDWVQDFERAFCPLCHEEMVFVAALGSMFRSGFVPEITINNGSGYQYHFACAPCRTLAVFGQNT